MSSAGRADAIAESGWAYPVRFWQPRNPAFWVYAFLVVAGAFTFHDLVRDVGAHPTAIVLSVVLLGLFVLPFVWFIAHTDRFEREPAKLALMGFLWGGLAATWVLALPGNAAILSIYAKLFAAGTVERRPSGEASSTPRRTELTRVRSLIRGQAG